MARVIANGIEKDIELFVFDKDGLMFKTQGFWAEIGNRRMVYLKKYLNEEALKEWARVFGLTLDEKGEVIYTDPKGILAVAAPREEVVVTAGLIVQANNIQWDTALEYAHDVFKSADDNFKLAKALVPQKGFPEIFERLRRAGIKYAIATSDTIPRAKQSLELFGEVPPEVIIVSDMVKRGKPAPDMLLLAAERCGVPIDKTAMLGDSFVDVKMAFDAGAAMGIGIPETAEMREEMKPYTKVIIDSLDDIILE